jgi:hypothetical protein
MVALLIRDTADLRLVRERVHFASSPGILLPENVGSDDILEMNRKEMVRFTRSPLRMGGGRFFRRQSNRLLFLKK